MRQELSGLAAENVKHQFLQIKMQRLEQMEGQLTSHIGFEQAVLFSCQTYIQIMEETPVLEEAQTTPLEKPSRQCGEC